MKNKKRLARLKRHSRIRRRIFGTAERPRLVVFRSLRHLSCQLVDDSQHKVIFSLSTFSKDLKKQFPQGANCKTLAVFGEIFAKRVQEKGITKIVFDRAGYLYHGRIKAFAEALRKGGLIF